MPNADILQNMNTETKNENKGRRPVSIVGAQDRLAQCATRAAYGEVQNNAFRPARPALIEKDVGYTGESASWASFFFMWHEIIFRYHGSTIPHIWVEMLISLTTSTVAYLLTSGSPLCGFNVNDPDAEMPCGRFTLTIARSSGHQIIGVLLSFLVVFRSQIAWNMYCEGRSYWGKLIAVVKFLAKDFS